MVRGATADAQLHKGERVRSVHTPTWRPWTALLCLALLAACGQTPSVPPGVKAVSYNGISIEVPDAWTAYKRPTIYCDVSGPTVIVGSPPSPYRPIPCPYVPLRATVVTLGGPDTVVPAGLETRRTIHGVSVFVSKATLVAGSQDHTLLYHSTEVVRFPGKEVWLRAYAPGKVVDGALVDADRIIATVHATGLP